MSVCIYTHNSNSDRRAENGYASESFEYFKFVHRLDTLIQDLLQYKPNIIGFCEVDKQSKILLENSLISEGFTIVVNSIPQAYAPYQQPDNSFYYVVAYKKSEITLLDNMMIWFTSTPRTALTADTRKSDRILLENKETFEKGSFICLFKDQMNNKFIYSINHYPLRDLYQQTSSRILNAELNKLQAEWQVDKVIVAGDFNTFPRDGSPDMRAINELSGYQICDLIGNTFCSYPYDLGLPTPESTAHMNNVLCKIEDPVEQRLAFGNYVLELHGNPIMSQLDWVLTKGIIIKNSLLNYDFNCDKESFIESCSSGKPKYPSDHAATIINF
jgi:hypothetical protein